LRSFAVANCNFCPTANPGDAFLSMLCILYYKF